MKDKFKKLSKNMGLLFISNFSSKILVFLLLPLYTSVLTTKEYGIYDIIYSSIQLIYPILTINIVDSIFRFTLDKNNSKSKVFTIGVKYALISIVICILATIFSSIFKILDSISKYSFHFILLYTVYIVHDLILQFVRGQDKVKDISIAGIIGTIFMIFTNILLLLVFKMGLTGYFIAMDLSLLSSILYLFFKNKLWNYFDIKHFSFKQSLLEKEMIKYCIPLIFITISWHINSVADRYAVTYISGIEVNGIYSIAYKIPAILNAIQVIFIQAWQISAIKEYKNKDDSKFYSSTYKWCQIVMTTLCSSLILFTRMIAHFLFASDFYRAWIYVPVLLIYIVFNTLSGTIGAVFSAAKDTKKLAISGIIGALINIILNIVLVYKYSAMGAAIATLISSVAIWLIRIIYLKKYINLKANYFGDMIQYLILIIQAILLINIKNNVYSYLIQLFLFSITIIINIYRIKEMNFELKED